MLALLPQGNLFIDHTIVTIAIGRRKRSELSRFVFTELFNLTVFRGFFSHYRALYNELFQGANGQINADDGFKIKLTLAQKKTKKQMIMLPRFLYYTVKRAFLFLLAIFLL